MPTKRDNVIKYKPSSRLDRLVIETYRLPSVRYAHSPAIRKSYFDAIARAEDNKRYMRTM